MKEVFCSEDTVWFHEDGNLFGEAAIVLEASSNLYRDKENVKYSVKIVKTGRKIEDVSSRQLRERIL